MIRPSTLFQTHFRRPSPASRKFALGRKRHPLALTDFARVLLLMDGDAAKAITFAETVLKAKPTDKGLRLLKALALFQADKADDAVKLLRELS